MNNAVPETEGTGPTQRVIGELVAPKPGPTLITIGSLHGNEPAGVGALQRVVKRLSGRSQPLRSGSLVGLVGNMAALEANRRFVDRDLNRNWNRPRLMTSDPPPRTTSVEDAEHHQLLTEIEHAIGRARGDVYILDLHTTSGDSPPFTVFADTLRSRRFARRLPNPIILGLEEHLVGTMVDYLAGRGYAAIAVEGGQHDDPGSVDRLEATLDVALHVLGIDPDVRRTREAYERLRTASRTIPRALEITRSHALGPDDRFRMHPGFRGFDRVRSGEILAADATGEVRAPTDGFLLMPLYQELGDDGFFIARPVLPFWLWVSRMLRTIRLDRVVHWLPGVTRTEGEPGIYHVNRRVARFFTLQVLHLLGFKKLNDGDELIVARRTDNQA